MTLHRTLTRTFSALTLATATLTVHSTGPVSYTHLTLPTKA